MPIPDALRLAQQLAAAAQPPMAEKEVARLLGDMPVTDGHQLEALTRAIYDNLIASAPDQPRFDQLSVEAKGAFVIAVESKVLPHAKPFETLVSRLTLDMLAKRRRFLDHLARQPDPMNPIARVVWRDQQDELQYEMQDAIEKLERFLGRFYARRARELMPEAESPKAD